MPIVVSDKTATITSDGSRRYFTVPANVKSGTVKYDIIGGGGGGGGSDSHPGGNGSAGGVVTGTLLVNAGDFVEVVVGGGGSRGESGRGSAAGGSGGLSYTDYNGGAGGRAGWRGSSGGGGGGGGATVIKINGVARVIAAGGAGGGGGGNRGVATGESASVIEGRYNQDTTNNYYSPISNGSYCEFLNNYGVDIGYGHTNVTYQWDVYFPTTKTYTFEVSGDNEADILCDGVQAATTGYWGGGRAPYQNVYTGYLNVTEGWHSVTINGRNYGGPGSVGGRIHDIPAGALNFTDIWNSRNARIVHISTNGQKGSDHPYDGGGGGGGGGGYLGGGGGYAGDGDVGGSAGYVGQSRAENGIVLGRVSHKQPTYSIYGVGGDAAYRGYSGSDGSGGLATITTNLVTRNLRHKNNGAWRSTNNAYVKENGEWKSCSEVWLKDNGVWKRSLLKTNATVTWLTDGGGTGSTEPTPYVPPPVIPVVPPVVPTPTCAAKGTFLRDSTEVDSVDDYTRTTTYKWYADGECGEYAEVQDIKLVKDAAACPERGTFLRDSTETVEEDGVSSTYYAKFYHDGNCGEYGEVVSITRTPVATVGGGIIDTGLPIVPIEITTTTESTKTGVVEIEVVDGIGDLTVITTTTTIFDDGSTITTDQNGNVVRTTESTDTVVTPTNDTGSTTTTEIRDDGSTISRTTDSTGEITEVESTLENDFGSGFGVTVWEGEGYNGGGAMPGGGCPDPDTPILISASSSVRAGSLIVGDYIYTMHETTKEYGMYKVLNAELVDQPKLRFTFKDGTSVVVSNTHRFLMGNDIWNSAFNLLAGESIKAIDGVKTITSITSVGIGPVVKFEIEDAHTYISAGLLSHNTKLEAESNFDFLQV